MQIAGPVTEISRSADSGAEKLKGFCSACGSPLYNKPVNRPDMIGIYVGGLTNPPVSSRKTSCSHRAGTPGIISIRRCPGYRICDR